VTGGNRTCTAANSICNVGGGTATCEACGGPNNSCCPGNLCTGGGCCTPGSTYGTCIAEDTDCPNSNGICQAGVCRGDAGACGGSGDPCCARPTGNGFCTADNQACTTATGGGSSCTACGGATQRCCRGSSCNTGLTCSGFGAGATCGQ
jgi:hypothetical protein